MINSTRQRRFAVLAAVAVICSIHGCSDETATDAAAAADATVDVGVRVPTAITLQAPKYIRIDWVGRFRVDVCSPDGKLTIDWGDGYRDTLDLAIIDLPTSKPGCRVFATSHIYGTVGVVKVSAEVVDGLGTTKTAQASVSVLPVPMHESVHSRSLTLTPPFLVAVSTDSDEISVFSRSTSQAWRLDRHVKVCKGPRSAAALGNYVAVSCPSEDKVQIYKVNSGDFRSEVSFEHGAAPFGVIWPRTGGSEEGDLWVALQGKNSLARLTHKGGGKVKLAGAVTVVDDPRELAKLPDGRIAVAQWRSDGLAAKVALFEPEKTGEVTTVSIPRGPKDAANGALTWLAAPLVTPDGKRAFIPGQVIANGAKDATPQLRGTLAAFNVGDGKPGSRWLTPSGLAGSGTFSSDGAWIYTTIPGNRSVVRFDLSTGEKDASIGDVGAQPDAVIATRDGRWLMVLARAQRRVMAYRLLGYAGLPQQPLVQLPLQSKEPFTASVLHGQRVFAGTTAAAGAEGARACAHCHLDGRTDRRSFDRNAVGEGLRNTPELLGRSGTGHGALFWTGSADEVQDVESVIRGHLGAKGLMSDADFAARKAALGAKKAGKSKDLDALAAYLGSLDRHPRSPFRNADGSFTKAALRGKKLFESATTGCTNCHKGANLTDSDVHGGKAVLHDVGTAGKNSGKAGGSALAGFDTPTLHGLWDTAPYLHDGSAKTLDDVFTGAAQPDKHGKTSHLSSDDRSDLVQYLLQLEGPGK